jgi:hypothetical protein
MSALLFIYKRYWHLYLSAMGMGFTYWWSEYIVHKHLLQELEHHINDKERRKWIREFLLFTIRITLEEHCM